MEQVTKDEIDIDDDIFLECGDDEDDIKVEGLETVGDNSKDQSPDESCKNKTPDTKSSQRKKSIKDTKSKNILNDEQMKAFKRILDGENVHICGPAGTGKSLLLVYCVQALRKMKLNVSVTAMTGVAANNLNESSEPYPLHATTLHWWFSRIEERDSAYNNYNNMHAIVKERINKTDVLIIDEISMLSPQLFDKVEQIVSIVNGKEKSKQGKPFGGIQLVLCGDWFQLEPVRIEYEVMRDYQDKHYCFEAKAWENCISDKNIIILRKNYRQQTDPQFQTLLDEIREGVLTESSVKILKSRIGVELDLPEGIKPTILLPKVSQVDQQNQLALKEINEKPEKFTIVEEVIGKLSEKEFKLVCAKIMKSIQMEKELELKIGVPVILIVNLSVDDGYVNEMQGVVSSFDETDGLPYVKFVNGKELKMERYTWFQKLKKRKNKSEVNGVVIKQLPLRIAAALTIHKSQSISLDFVKLDLGSNTFAGGQAYTGLSRCRTLKGLCLTDFHVNSIKVNHKVISFYKKHSALKYRIIDDGGFDPSGKIESMVFELLKKHIPSAVEMEENRGVLRKKRTYDPKKFLESKQEKSTSLKRHKPIVAVSEADKICPL